MRSMRKLFEELNSKKEQNFRNKKRGFDKIERPSHNYVKQNYLLRKIL